MTIRHFSLFTLLWLVCTAQLALAASDSVSSKTYKELTEIQEIMGQGQSDEAYNRLRTLLDEVAADTLDQALTLQTLGYVEMAREDFRAAIGYLKQSLALNKLPQSVVYNVGYMVAQLHAALGEYDQALTFAKEWFSQLQDPKPAQYIFMANIYAQTKRYEESLPYAEKAIAASEQPKETWYQLLTASYFELKRYRDAADNLQKMVDNWPDKPAYWEQLASVYVILKDEAAALAVLKIAFAENILAKETTIKSLVQLTVLQGIPEHAARLLESAFERELLEPDADYLEMLAVALAAAKERERAIAAYQRMAAQTDSGEPWIAMSNIYVELGNWQQAESALASALDSRQTKTLKSPGKAWLLMGIAQAEQQKFEQAKTSFKKSAAFDDTAKPATRWLKYNEDMQRQADWVAQNREVNSAEN